MPRLTHRALKGEVLRLLTQEDLPAVKEKIKAYPPRQAVNPLIGALCHREEEVRWKAVAAIGVVVAEIANVEMEQARIIIRRFMWMLNEESGGMAWGVPEAMAEALASHEGLAQEYTSILISYVWPEGNYLEYPPAQRGVIWGVGRLAQVFPELVKKHHGPAYTLHLADSEDPFVRTFWTWAVGQMGREVLGSLLPRVLEKLKAMPLVSLELLFYDGKRLRRASFREILNETLYQLT